MHPELSYRIAQLHHDELLSANRHHPAPTRRGIRNRFRRRRDTAAVVLPEPAPIVLLPPPREERDPTGHDQRVA